MSDLPENPVVDLPQDSLPEKDSIDLLIEHMTMQEHDLILREVGPIKIKGKDGLVSYKLRELTSTQRGEYMNLQAGQAKFNDKGNFAGMKDVRAFEVRLVSMSLVTADNKPVMESVIGAFPGLLVSNMAKVVRRISGMDDKAEAEAKKP